MQTQAINKQDVYTIKVKNTGSLKDGSSGDSVCSSSFSSVIHSPCFIGLETEGDASEVELTSVEVAGVEGDTSDVAHSPVDSLQD